METDKNIQNDDVMLTQFFAEQRQKIADNGFSDRVMRQLPQRAKRFNRVWTAVCAAAAVAFFVLFNGLDELRVLGGNMVGDASGYLSSIDFSSTSPIITVAGMAVLGVVACCNLSLTR